MSNIVTSNIEVPAMEPVMRYHLAPDGEIVKVLPAGYEYTGMYILQD